MALSYSLNVENLQNIQVLTEALIRISEFNDGFTPLFASQGAFRFTNPNDPVFNDIYPTGEYIIRDGMYVNGYFIYVGSYKAYCIGLDGGNFDGYAWDGFIMAFRGYSLNESSGGGPIFNENGTFNAGFGFLPMRMMFEVNPGASGSAAAIAADSAVGLHSIEVFKNIDDISVTGGDYDIRIITCGFQRVNPSVESVPTGMDYVANLYLGTLFEGTGTKTQVTYKENTFEVNGLSYDPANMMQVTWEASQTGHADNTIVNGRFGMLRDLDEFFSANTLITTAPYDFSMWSAGQKPDGTNPSGGSATGNDTRANQFNYFPRRFLDVSCFSETSISATLNAESPFYVVGDVSMDSNNDGSIDDTCPVFVGGAYPYGAFLAAINGDSPYSYLGPFLNAAPAMATSLAADPSWTREDLTPSYNFSGAYACLVSIPYENTASINYDALPITLIGVNNVTHSGSSYGELYAVWESPLNPAVLVNPFAVQGGSFTTATGIELPTQWYNKAVQFRTFTIDEEDIGKIGTLSTETGEFTPTSASLYDTDGKEYVGIDGNYRRYGSFTNPLAPNQPQGTRSGAAYGFLGIKTGTGPIAIMFDSGSPTQTDNGADQDFTITVRGEGANLNANSLTNPTSTTRKVVNCGWDNDRDQWLFMTSDTTGFGAISVSSDFNTDSNNLGFLDQTANFINVPSSADAGFYTPLTMSNSMDGWTFFGVLDTDSNVRFGIKPPSLGAVDTITVNTGNSTTADIDTYPLNIPYIYRITGTTGRTARVWVDYVLFDGPDAIIANKIKEKGMKVSIEAVEWFKRQIIQTGDLNITAEEIEMWMRDQQDEYKQTLKEIERQGRIRRKKKQVSAYLEGVEEQINPDYMDTEVKDHLEKFIPKTRPPTPEEARIEKKKKGGYSPEQGSYYDEVFED